MSFFKSISKIFGGASAPDPYEQFLRTRGHFDCRNVGGTYRIADEDRQKWAREGSLKTDAVEATVFISELSREEQCALLIGKNSAGETTITYLANMAQPDTPKMVNWDAARRQANFARRIISKGVEEQSSDISATEKARNAEIKQQIQIIPQRKTTIACK